MKHTILLYGSHGVKVAQALLWSACAGAFDADADLLLADLSPKPQEALQALLADYRHVQGLCGRPVGESGPFRASLDMETWPEALPEDLITLRQWASNPADAMLCRSLFAHSSADASAVRGFDQSPDAARAVMDALLDQPGSPMETLVCGEGKIILCGSAAHAASAAAMAAMASRLAQAGCAQRTSAVLLLPYTEEDAPTLASSALESFAATGLETVFTLGLDEGDAAACKAEAPHLVEWQAVCCMQACLQSSDFTPGLYTWRLAPGPLQWAGFGPEGEAMHSNWGAFIKAAALFTMHLAPGLRRAVNAPNWLRDRKLLWLGGYFGQLKHMTDDNKQLLLHDLGILMRVMDGARLWVEQLLQNLPPILSQASAVEAARHAAQENYAQLMEATGRAEMLRQSLTGDDPADEAVNRYGDEDVDARHMEEALRQLEQSRDQLRARHEALTRQLGGSASLQVMKAVRRKLQGQSRELHTQAEEAQRRIDVAAQLAQADELHRVATARTKLARLTRYIQQLDLQLDAARQDEQQAAQQRRLPPEMTLQDAPPENALFNVETLSRLRALPQDDDLPRHVKQLLQNLTDDWQGLVLPPEGPHAQHLLDSLQTPTRPGHPLGMLALDVIHACTKEVRP